MCFTLFHAIYESRVLFTISIVAMCFTLFHMTGVMHVDGTLVSMAGSAFGYFSGLSSFLFGFFIFDNLATYLTVKNTYLGGFWGSFSDLMMLTACWFPGDDDDNKEFKRSLIRWGLAAFALMCGGAGGEITMDAVIEQVQERNMLTSDEAQIVKRLGGSASVPLMWMFEVFETNIHEKSLLGAEFKVDKIESVVMRMRGSISGVLTAVSSFGLTPLPLVHLMSALVKMVRWIPVLLILIIPSHLLTIFCGCKPPPATLPPLDQGGRRYS